MSNENALNEGRYIIGSFGYIEQKDPLTSWGWKYAFGFNNPLSIEQLHELSEVITNHLNSKK